MNHDEHRREALALEALGALDAGERGTLAEHLAACAACARERKELSAVVAMLAHAVTPVAPPKEVRTALLSRVREPGEARAGEAGRVLRPPPTVFRRTRPPAWAYGALAASLVLAALLLLSWRENGALRRELASSAEESRGARAALEGRLGEAVRERAELQRQLGELLTAPGSGLARLNGTKDAPHARASLAYDRETGRALLLAAGLPPAPAGSAYQLWYFGDRTPLPGPVFQTDAEGRASLSDTIPAGRRRARAFAVTLEPAGGVDSPTGSVYLAGPAA